MFATLMETISMTNKHCIFNSADNMVQPINFVQNDFKD